eukprot:PhF_6_TR35182/c0_g1_i1/m.51250
MNVVAVVIVITTLIVSSIAMNNTEPENRIRKYNGTGSRSNKTVMRFTTTTRDRYLKNFSKNILGIKRDKKNRSQYLVTAIANSVSDVTELSQDALAIEIVSDIDTNASAAPQYSNLSTIMDRMRRVLYNCPEISSLYEIGRSQEYNKPLLALKLSPFVTNHSMTIPEVIFVGTHHAREWIAAEVPMALAEHLCSQYRYNTKLRKLIENTEMWFVPVLNPDGYETSFQSGSDNSGFPYRYWRKNMRGGYGVDLNRNYDQSWGDESGSSGNPADETYRGSSAFSEAETNAFQKWVMNQSVMSDPIGMIAYHSYGQTLLYPMSANSNSVPNENLQRKILETAASLINASTSAIYEVMKSSELYYSNGDACDWFTVQNNMAPCVTMELPPDDNQQYTFELPNTQIPTSVDQGIIGSLYYADYLLSARNRAGFTSWSEEQFNSSIVNVDLNMDNIVDYLQSCVLETGAQTTVCRTTLLERLESVAITLPAGASYSTSELNALQDCLQIDGLRFQMITQGRLLRVMFNVSDVTAEEIASLATNVTTCVNMIRPKLMSSSPPQPSTQGLYSSSYDISWYSKYFVMNFFVCSFLTVLFI